MLWPVLALLIVGLVISLPATAVLVRMGRRLGALDSAGSDGHRKLVLRDVPNIGGVAIFAAVALPVIVGVTLLHIVGAETWARWLPALEPLLPRLLEGGDGARSSSATALALVGCMAALHLVGLIDDRRGLGAWPKLLVQAAAAAVMTLWFDVRLLEMLGPAASVVITIAWIVVVTNAINFMDNMDGLAGGVAVIVAVLFMLATLVNHQWFIAGVLALLAGALAGFLVFNFPPARIFMGDGGSLVVGFLLAVLTARTTFYDPSNTEFALGSAWYGVFMPIVVLAIPLYDLTAVTLIRLKQGKSPLVGDQQHFSHRLVQRGLSPRGAVVVIWGATAVTGIGGISMGRLEPWQAILVGVQTLLVLMVIALLEHASRRSVPGEPER
ncbi:MAG: undecaprenyl/decaprenyl-phosphate alpha-N-acetylglucosaminyl 1-phosphate transferase [Planctomycetes bacterium]|nr:undecaprenyl/decaprenyl-phosphate alpha-N-acetylglucosaminyl 1-phosphate transferase [Planctomycetota bacterium]